MSARRGRELLAARVGLHSPGSGSGVARQAARRVAHQAAAARWAARLAPYRAPPCSGVPLHWRVAGGASAQAHRASAAHRAAAAHRAVAVHRAAPARRAPYRGSGGSWWLVCASGVPLPDRSRSTIKLKAAPRCINFGSVKILGCGRCRSELIMHHEDWTRSHMLCQQTL